MTDKACSSVLIVSDSSASPSARTHTHPPACAHTHTHLLTNTHTYSLAHAHRGNRCVSSLFSPLFFFFCHRHPPGDEVYRHDNVSMFEVDGKKAKIYCQVILCVCVCVRLCVCCVCVCVRVQGVLVCVCIVCVCVCVWKFFWCAFSSLAS